MLLLLLHVKYNVIKTINNPTLCCPKSKTPFTNAVCGRVFDNSMQSSRRGFIVIPDLSHHRTYGSVYGGSINLTCNTPFGVVI